MNSGGYGVNPSMDSFACIVLIYELFCYHIKREKHKFLPKGKNAFLSYIKKYICNMMQLIPSVFFCHRDFLDRPFPKFGNFIWKGIMRTLELAGVHVQCVILIWCISNEFFWFIITLFCSWSSCFFLFYKKFFSLITLLIRRGNKEKKKKGIAGWS